MTIKPGTRLWATGFLISRKTGHIETNLPPTYVEFTCGGDNPDYENTLRQRNTKATRIAPVTLNGQPNFEKDMPVKNLHFFETKQQAEMQYFSELQYERLNISKRIETLEQTVADIDILIDALRSSHIDETTG